MLFSLAWGSFLNMLAYRLISGESLLINRSFCPHCKHSLAWYDLVPLLSWLLLNGNCRYCKNPISFLYPLIELITVITMYLLTQLISPFYWPAYGIFFSALIVTIRTDLEHMLISRFVTIFLIPLAFIVSYLRYIPLALSESILGSITAYSCLYLINKLFLKLTGKDGLGQGDNELLALIGSFIGIQGWWLTLMIGSLLGSCYGLLLITARKNYSQPIPFGPFLALGAILTTLFHYKLYYLLGF